MIVRIAAKWDGFRRCGIAHPAQPVDHPAERFSADELERLQAEPLLIVQLLDDDGQPLKVAASAKSAAKAPAKAGK
ncbi:hypothetical protein D3C78_1532330 [compost metagenome]